MKNMIKFGFLALAIVTLFAVVAGLIPRAARAAAEAAQQAVTPTANVDYPPRNPWSAACTFSGPVSDDLNCAPLPTVPKGEEIVIQGIDFYTTISPAKASGHLIISLTTTTGGNPARWDGSEPIVGLQDLSLFQAYGPIPISGTLPVSRGLILYADPGTPIEVHAKFSSPLPASAPGQMANGKVTLVGCFVKL